MRTIPIEYPTDWTDYELLDSGSGAKLERFGSYTIVRPDPRAIWHPSLSQDQWDKASAVHTRTSDTTSEWKIKQEPPNPWHVKYHDLTFTLKPTEFKHVGIFPEQAVNWNWLQQTIDHKPLEVLNLFAYTGGATLAVAQAGGTVTHIDSVKSTISWAKENMTLSKLDHAPIRWIEDDAYKFVIREGRRGKTYDGIIMDPPRFGRGSKGEVWKLIEDLPKLLSACQAILTKEPTFIVINAYTADISALALHHMLSDMTKNLGGTITFGELALKESTSERLLPNGIFARWSRS